MAPNISSAVGSGNADGRDPSIVETPKVAELPWTVEKALDTITSIRPQENTSNPVAFFHLLERLKIVKREGWRRFGIHRGESIADHSCRMAMMTIFAPPSLKSKLDMSKCMKMALIHDMAESLAGDIIPHDNVSKPEKRRWETLTVEYITRTLLGNVDEGNAGSDIAAIFEEHEEGQTLESRFVSDMDKIELLLQMVEYEKRSRGRLDLTEFTYVATKGDLPETKAWAQEILREREKFWSGSGVAHHASVTDETKKFSDQYYGK